MQPLRNLTMHESLVALTLSHTVHLKVIGNNNKVSLMFAGMFDELMVDA